MAQQTPEQKTALETALEEFKQISDVLTVPAIGKELPTHRKWKLPCSDQKALADHPAGRLDEKVKECLLGKPAGQISGSGSSKHMEKEVKHV